ncbi:hypothetical protein, partial [Glycomyces tenuis]|uniref:DUF7927 domain-containing protein n=1 Tax=Glycomyces tenuis TaxID=58116 RepID=UPI000557A579
MDDAEFVEGSLVVDPDDALLGATFDEAQEQVVVAGMVGPGETVTVSFQVTVLPDGERGDNSLADFLLDPGEDPPAECTDDNPDCTVNPVPELSDSKSVDPASGTVVGPGDT